MGSIQRTKRVLVPADPTADADMSDVKYTSQRVNVPSELPQILKQYTKALIKTQPPNYIAWSAAYFASLAEGRPLPIKPRLEAADGQNLTIGLLEVIIDQLGQNHGSVSLAKIEARWCELGLQEIDLADTLIRGKLIDELKDIQEDPAMVIDLHQFIACSPCRSPDETTWLAVWTSCASFWPRTRAIDTTVPDSIFSLGFTSSWPRLLRSMDTYKRKHFDTSVPRPTPTAVFYCRVPCSQKLVLRLATHPIRATSSAKRAQSSTRGKIVSVKSVALYTKTIRSYVQACISMPRINYAILL